MTYAVYGLREIGSLEIRYIGQTAKGWQARLRFLLWLARSGQGDPAMREWLRSCDFHVEGITLATTATEPSARLRERDAIGMFSAAGHRLLNRQHMPKTALETIEPWQPKDTPTPSTSEAA